MDIPSLAVMMVAPTHHPIMPGSVTGHPRPDLDKAPLTGRAVPLAGATQGRQGEAMQTRDTGLGGQDWR